MATSILKDPYTHRSTNGIQIPSGADLNDYTTPGLYLVRSSSIAQSLSNCPYPTTYGRLEVMEVVNGGNTRKQLYFPAATNMYYRMYYGETAATVWGPWRRFDVPAKMVDLGRTFSEYNWPAFGHVTNNSTEAHFYIPFTISSMFPSSGFTFTALRASMRIPTGGFFVGDNSDVLRYVTLTALSEFGLAITLKNNSGFGCTNNIPIAGTVKITGEFYSGYPDT